MNLSQVISIYGGGPGSGCKGPNCGRPGSGKTEPDSGQRNENFLKELNIQTKQITPNSGWDYLDTPKGQSTLHIKNVYDFKKGDFLEIHWLIAEQRGAGRAAMERMAELADKHNVKLGLWALPLPAHGENAGIKMTKARLESWYKQFGFKVDRRAKRTKDAYMVRMPSKGIKAYGTPEGLEKAWDTRGRGRKRLSEIAQRALASYKPVDPENRRMAAASELAIAKAIGGQHMGDNFPFDVVKGDVVVEIKTMMKTGEDRINMKTRSRLIKEAYVKNNGARAYTVAVDLRSGKAVVYYKKGVGAYTLSSMERLTNMRELRSVLK